MATPQRNNATLELRDLARVAERLPTPEAPDVLTFDDDEGPTQIGPVPPPPRSLPQQARDQWDGAPAWARGLTLVLVSLVPVFVALIQALTR